MQVSERHQQLEKDLTISFHVPRCFFDASASWNLTTVSCPRLVFLFIPDPECRYLIFLLPIFPQPWYSITVFFSLPWTFETHIVHAQACDALSHKEGNFWHPDKGTKLFLAVQIAKLGLSWLHLHLFPSISQDRLQIQCSPDQKGEVHGWSEGFLTLPLIVGIFTPRLIYTVIATEVCFPRRYQSTSLSLFSLAWTLACLLVSWIYIHFLYSSFVYVYNICC